LHDLFFKSRKIILQVKNILITGKKQNNTTGFKVTDNSADEAGIIRKFTRF